MTNNELYAMELLLGGHLHGRKIGQSYCTYFLTEACITNPEALDKWLLNNGYIRMPNIHEVLSLYNIKELKCFLQSFGLKISGKKDELISRLIDNAPGDFLDTELSNHSEYYFLSDKGAEFYYNNIDLEKYHKYIIYDIPLNEYFQYRKSGITNNFEDIAYIILTKQIDDVNWNSSHVVFNNFKFMYLSEICERQKIYENALYYALLKLYFDVNLMNNYGLFYPDEYVDLYLVRSIDKMVERIDSSYIFNKYLIARIAKFSNYYHESIIDEIYSSKYIKRLFLDKINFKQLVCDIFESSTFDGLIYINIIKSNYRNFLTKKIRTLPKNLSKPSSVFAKLKNLFNL